MKKFAQIVAIISGVIGVIDVARKVYKHMNTELFLELGYVLIFIIAVGVLVWEEYKNILRKIDDVIKIFENNSKEFNELKEWVMFKEYDDTAKYTSLDNKIRQLGIKR